MPADQRGLALYLADLARTGTSAATVGRRLAGIRSLHREAGEAAPDGAELRAVLAGIRRTHGRPPRKKRALVTEDLRKVLRKVPDDTLAGLRDRAMLLVGFSGALRRSELALISLSNDAVVQLQFVGGGALLNIARSKGDQEGRGASVAIPTGKKLCPVAALEAWIKAAGITSGPVFRSIDRHGRMGDVAMSGQAVANVVKRAVAAAGFDPAKFGGHSLRAGLVTSAFREDVAVGDVQRQTRHAKVDTLLGYQREADLFKRNAAGRLGL
jgi:integrase